MNEKDFKIEMQKMFEKEEKELLALKNEWIEKINNLIDTSELIEWLNDMDWSPIGIVDIKLTDEKKLGYSTYQHARIIDDKDKHLYMKHDFSDFSDYEKSIIDHYYVWQTVGYLGDDYSGYLLFPLKNGKYFKVDYVC